MITQINANQIYSSRQVLKGNKQNLSFNGVSSPIQSSSSTITSQQVIKQPSTVLNNEQKQKYLYLLEFLKDKKPKTASNTQDTPFGQLNHLLKNGKLLAKTSHDGSNTLDNLYSIATTPRAYNLDSANLILNTLDLLCYPQKVTQTFGDIPENIQKEVVKKINPNNPVKQNPNLMNVETSGTCPAASIEVNMADKYPAEFARWVACLSSEKKGIELNVDVKSISKNPLEAMEIVDILEAKKIKGDLHKLTLKLDLDDTAFVRAFVQENYWDKGERSVVDVLIQSAIMKLGSQNTYNPLSDIRQGQFTTNPQGLIELEKTFVETLVKNREITSLVYHQIDDEQNIVGYNCSIDKIAKHITDTIDSGENVILGYVFTNESIGKTKSVEYNEKVNGGPKKVLGGHEITVVDYYKDENGKLIFVCIDTDDNSDELIKYDAESFLPNVHHAGYPAHIVEADEKEIMSKLIS